jgi:tetratricopeptide (TPR) repeat protein
MPSRPIATIVLAPLVALAVVACGIGGDSRIPITTSSPEALDLYLQGRQLSDRLRYTDARGYFDRAVAKDTDFALAHLGVAMTSAISNEFFASLGRAVELSDKVTDGERHMILAYLAGVSGDPLQQDEHLAWLVDNYPGDERAMNLRGNYHFGRQEFDDAVACYEKATAINPEFSQPYNQLGYVYRFQGRSAQGEEASRKYIDLIPDEPNPFDSYAELLMKLGRFEESIETYKKALALDRHFMASYIGVGHNFLLLDRPDEARSWFRRLSEVARTSLERRQAHMWSAAAFLHEGRDREALKEVEAMYAIAEKDGNVTAMSTDLTRMGHILLEAGAPEGALARFRDSLAIVEEAEVPLQVKEFRERATLYFEARAALSQELIEIAEHKTRMFAVRVEAHQIPAEIRRLHELKGRIALHRENYRWALEEFEQANQQDPRVLYLTALAYRGQGDHSRARDYGKRAAKFNGIDFNYAFVRERAQRMLSDG